MGKEQFEFIKRDTTTIKGIAWTMNNKLVANVVIITGMAEKADRYDHFANFLNQHGFNVYCLDHVGQGLNSPTIEHLGIWGKSEFRKSVFTNLELVRKLKVSCVPIYVIGHSMGSFILQDFIQRFGKEIDKAIICGSNGPTLKSKLGGVLIRQVATFKGRNYRSKFVHNLIFKNYNKQFKPSCTEYDWLSTDSNIVNDYIADPYCGFVPTVGFYVEFIKGINRLYKKNFLRKIPNYLPILLISGAKDPVGANGKGVIKLEKLYQKFFLNVKTIIYENMHHEILNDINRQHVYNDILLFLTTKN